MQEYCGSSVAEMLLAPQHAATKPNVTQIAFRFMLTPMERKGGQSNGLVELGMYGGTAEHSSLVYTGPFNIGALLESTIPFSANN